MPKIHEQHRTPRALNPARDKKHSNQLPIFNAVHPFHIKE